MIGPSSSHTAGAARIGRVARDLFGKEPTWVEIRLYGSFAKTYKGHGTDVALIGGILDFETYDPRIAESMDIARAKGITFEFIEEDSHTDHPNTARVKVGDEQSDLELVGISIGGGKAEIIELNGFELRLSGSHPAILVMHNDRFGAIAEVTQLLAKYEINIGHMEVSRKEVGKEALMVIEVDQNISEQQLEELATCEHILQVARVVE